MSITLRAVVLFLRWNVVDNLHISTCLQNPHLGHGKTAFYYYKLYSESLWILESAEGTIFYLKAKIPHKQTEKLKTNKQKNPTSPLGNMLNLVQIWK